MSITIAVFGGSFDPPHIGHALTIQWILWSGQANAVWVMPAARHAFGKDSQPYTTRLNMCRAMAKHFEKFFVQVSDTEGKLAEQTDGPVYTYDVLDHLREVMDSRGGATLRLVVGSDVLQETDRWHRWDDIVKQFNPIIIGREGHPVPEPVPPGLTILMMPGYSSTELRRLLAECSEEESWKWESWVLPAVRDLLPGPYRK